MNIPRWPLLVFAAVGIAACVIVEGPGDLPALPTYRPTIRRDSLEPLNDHILVSLPKEFVAEVEQVDPTETFSYRLYANYEKTGRPGVSDDLTLGLVDEGKSAPNLSGTRVRAIRPTVRQPLDPTRCWIIELIVAREFDGSKEGRAAHASPPESRDSVIWFYSANGDASGCISQETPILLDGGPSTTKDASKEGG